MQVLMLIEERENASAITPQKFDDAMLRLLHARVVCHQGHVVDALAIYDSVAQKIASDPVLSENKN
jgi:hypothetical protein